MSLGPFLRRELITSVRRGTAFSDRRSAVVLLTMVVAACVVVWDWWGWDRASVAGAASLALTTFGLMVAAQVVLTLVSVPAMVAPAIASERDRKSLDSLLATPVSAAEIVLGAMGAGLLRYANSLVGLGPVVTLSVFLGGIDPRLVLLAVAGLSSTAVALAALAAVVSAGARTARRAMSVTAALSMTWMCLPMLLVMLLPRVWPAAVPWVAPVAVRVLDSSPVGVEMNFLGAIPRGPMVVAVPKMIALQAAAAVVLVLWAIARLRPASRAVYDVEGRAAILRSLRARWRPRPPCGDDPVLWHEIHSRRPMSDALIFVDRLLNVLWIGLIAYATSWFAVPAFEELSRIGCGPTPGTLAVPELNPIARVIAAKMSGFPAAVSLAPGQARLEFNIVLRQTTGLLDFLYVLMVAGAAAESLVVERERDTWLGLIATPLTGREILRAKMLGAVWKTRLLGLMLLGFWTVGLLAGAVHPLGFLAAIAGTGASCWFLAALGVSISLGSRDRGEATNKALVPLMLFLIPGTLPFVLPGTASVVLAAGSMPFQAWASLLSYDDVHALVRSSPIPQFATIGINSGEGARIVLTGWLITTTALAVGAFLVSWSAVRGFDAAIGRPIRSRTRGDSSRKVAGSRPENLGSKTRHSC
jgi:ABC-type Na+ efflux pump permease subunit